jgi:hypothetical protein
MTTRTALVVAIAWLAAVAGAVSLVFAGSAETSLSGGGYVFVMGGLALAVVTDASVGAVLTLRRRGNIVGLVLMLAGILPSVSILGVVVGAVLTADRGRHDVLAGLVGLVGVLGLVPALIVAGPVLALVFPSGRLPGARWRWPVGAIVAAISVGSVTVILRPGPIMTVVANNPFGVNGYSGSEAFWVVGQTLAVAPLPFALLLAVAAVIVRMGRSVGVERAQLKWFVAANIAVGAFWTLSLAGVARPNPTIFDVLAAGSLSLPPIAVGVAILRYRLFEIDRIISRTLSWAVVTGLLGAVFVGLVVGFQALSATASDGNSLAVAASTLVVAALFQPLRRRIQSAVDRRFNRAGYDAQRTVETFAEQLRNEVDLARLRIALVDSVEHAVRPASASVWLRSGADVAR